MVNLRHRLGVYLVAGVVVSGGSWVTAQEDGDGRNGERRDKALFSMRVSPAIAFSPARVAAVAELRGSPADEASIYCAAVEWEWGDGTRSSSESDCDPYEAGKSEIKRRYSAGHVFNEAGRYRIHIRLKRQNKVVMATSTTVHIRPGLREWGER
jgi:hypothetical protein